MEKFKIKVDRKLWDVLSGQIVTQRRSSLPILTVGAVGGKFNRVAQNSIVANADRCNFYKLKNGILLVELGDQGILKITKYFNKARGIKTAGVSTGSLRKYIFNEMKNQKLQYHFYLHPTDREGLYMLKELTNSWE